MVEHLAAGEQFQSILIAVQPAVAEVYLVRLNERGKRTVFAVAFAEVAIEHCLAVPIVGDGDAEQSEAPCIFPYVERSRRIGGVHEAGFVLCAVQRIPLDDDVVLYL